MTPEGVRATLLSLEGKRVRLTFDDGVIESADVHSVDDEGFVHSRPNLQEQRSMRPQLVSIPEQYWWTRFESVTDVQPDDL